MMAIHRVSWVLVLVWWLAPAALGAQPPSLPEPQSEFVPLSELPPQDQLPAAPLLISAYSFVMLALFAYLFSVARRLQSVHRELERLEADVKRAPPPASTRTGG
jgi:CcmD family protein